MDMLCEMLAWQTTLADCLDFMASMWSGGEALSAMCISFCQKLHPRPERSVFTIIIKGLMSEAVAQQREEENFVRIFPSVLGLGLG